MILLTLGSYPLPFDRLASWVDEIAKENLLKEEIFAQIGYSNYIPKNLSWKKMIAKDEFDKLVTQCSGIISHAGMGNITLAINIQKPLIVVPRLVEFGEHVSDHQVATAKKFEEQRHVLAAYTKEELKGKLMCFKSFLPEQRYATPQKIACKINEYLKTII
ncbi:hypothetical protein DSCO28_18640 [Desulfosarcina ovata subsp. sediminis]|uniref:Glycosyl transferase family 28 C-terminal domain-containing protein n=1 Tax=Desulfosarcina ovata subsp. sediminis TaxID=885957 RepID=A0A5K7ZGH5_9BACT|nr:glycosyltransferase [Desulfosarcina ovata]BBO81298.1 hypothetical protein DSCO28_18640 [Desulfosarcina ovata subsp. sediminis]